MILVADVGGTHARLALTDITANGNGSYSLIEMKIFRCDQFNSLIDLVNVFADLHKDIPIKGCAIAAAGYITDDVVHNVNLCWTVSISAVRNYFKDIPVIVINDFDAMACGSCFATQKEMVNVYQVNDLNGQDTVGIVGPGTGFGSAAVVHGFQGLAILHSEAGQTLYAPETDLEKEIVSLAIKQGTRPVIEAFISGPGLSRLLQLLSKILDEPCDLMQAEDITRAAIEDRHVLCRKSIDTFCGMLGSVTGELAIAFGARGGIKLAGGVTHHLKDFISKGPFIPRYLDKGNMTHYMEGIPVDILVSDTIPLIGAAVWLEQSGQTGNIASVA